MPAGGKVVEQDEPLALVHLLADLPEWVTRRQAAQIIPGLLAESTFRNADARGRGPRGWRYTGTGIQYETRAVLVWIEERFL